MMKGRVFIGRVAKAAGLSVQAVRYYERLGLLPLAHRTESGYRVYGAETEDRLRFIKRAQALGFSLNEVREILRLRYEGTSPCECVRKLLQTKLDQVERQIRELEGFRHDLRQTLRQSRKLPRLPHNASSICPLIEKIAPQREQGPRNLKRA
jgi:MerR family copper efflux transcriptional regulator